jgi:hypothetical protein
LDGGGGGGGGGILVEFHCRFKYTT